jgi:hypothetical protein
VAVRLVGTMEKNESWRWASVERGDMMKKKKSTLAAGNWTNRAKGI